MLLDAGGGPGRYTAALAKRGYEIVLLDLVPENLEFAGSRLKRLGLMGRIRGLVEGSIEDLSAFPSESFDAVLCLGAPLSHLMSSHERKRAVSELVRVAKVDAPIFVSVINKFSALIYELRGKYLLAEPDGTELFRPLLEEGDHTGKYLFTDFHGFLPEELRETLSRPDVEILEMVGLEGLGAHHPDEVNKLARDRKLWRLWLEAHYKICTHPSVVGTSEHALLVGRKIAHSP
ncbi:MAG: class I SAM-dependent methyltransferase [Thaumarchaeota archaeon]|nr:class I SAM-dependent methyltransferase [Nitrososphaerota archaeon]